MSRLCLAVLVLLLALIPAPPYGTAPAFDRPRRGRAALLVGVHAPNRQFNEQDYVRIAEGEFGTVKMMGYHPPAAYDRLRAVLPDLRFFVRLFTPWNELPAPEQFVAANAPQLRALVDAGHDLWVEIGNEPNLELHPQAEATFTAWYLEVLAGLRAAVPEAKYGFPGLARHLREVDWLEASAPAVEASDWLGAHAYWETEREMLDPHGALKLTAFHQRFPEKPIVVSEAGSLSHAITPAERGGQYARFVRTLSRLPYVQAVHFFILSGTEEWRRFFFDQSMVTAVRRAAFDPLPAWAKLLGFRDRSARRGAFSAELEPQAGPRVSGTPARPTPVPTPTPEPFFRRRLLSEPTPAAAAVIRLGPTSRIQRLLPALPPPAAALRTASAYTVTDFSARFAIAPPVEGQAFALQIAETDTFASSAGTGFALLWDGDSWRLQYRRAGRLAVNVPLGGVPTALAEDEWLQAEVALEPRSAAAWIWRRGERQPEAPNAVFAPPEEAALDGARARALFLPAHPLTNLVLEGATRYS